MRVDNLAQLYRYAALEFGDRVSHKFRVGKEFKSYTFNQTAKKIDILALGLHSFGVSKGSHVGFFIDNRHEWILSDMALIMLQAISVPRGADTAPVELKFIFNHSDSEFLILENKKQLDALIPIFENKDWKICKKIFVVDDFELSKYPLSIKKKIVFFSELFKIGKEGSDVLLDINSIDPDDLVSIVYTSGTTGNPKGVMLSHRNFIENIAFTLPRLPLEADKSHSTVVMLPSWHVYEKTYEYTCLYLGVRLFYSNVRRFASDLVAEKPNMIITVPRIWESIYSKLIKNISQFSFLKRFIFLISVKISQMFLTSSYRIKGSYISLRKRNFLGRFFSFSFHLVRVLFLAPLYLLVTPVFSSVKAKLGGHLNAASCGAGALPKYLDELFNAMRIKIINSYGMTECAPGIATRTVKRNCFGVTGTSLGETRLEIRKSDGSLANVGEKGVIYVSGPQVMKGYYKNQKATDEILKDGWLCTGDLAVFSQSGEIIIVGREKDTIVLSGGENIEPEIIESKISESMYIDHAIVLGQDKKRLSALVAVNEEALLTLATELKIKVNEVNLDGENSIENDRIYNILKDEVGRLISKENGFRPFEKITSFIAIKNSFKIGEELTQSLKLRRKFISEKYHSLIKKLLKDSQGKKRK